VILLRSGLKSFLSYLWSGWGAIASLMLFLAIWEWAGLYYGELILPNPRITFQTLAGLIADGSA